MAYGVKYRFQLESYNQTVYRVDISEDGYSGGIVKRPLGRAPVIRMQESNPFRTTSCDLVLECQSDGEYVDLYTTNPFQFKVEVQWLNGNAVTGIWRGYIATEIYSEPDIAPPYDVKVTATDGIGILKEYAFVPTGSKTIRAHICDILKKAGDAAPMFYYATQLSEYQSTAKLFMDQAEINLDYMVGRNYYEVLQELLSSLRSVLIYRGGYWLIVREVDVQIESSGVLTAVQCIGGDSTLAATNVTVKMGKSVGKMGVADMWPVGYLTRRVVPAKKSVKVRSDWHLKDGSPDLLDWGSSGEATSGSVPRSLGNMGGQGTIYAVMLLGNFLTDIRITIKAWRGSVWQNYNGAPWVGATAMWQPSVGTVKYYHPDTGWTTDSPATWEEHAVDRTNGSGDPALAEEISINIPGPSDSSSGNLVVYVAGHLVSVYDVDVELVTMKGYEDTIIIANGARGSAADLSITGGREIPTFLISANFADGIWTNNSNHSLITSFSDRWSIGRDFLSLTALAYATEVAAPRIEISGKLDHVYDSQLGMPPPFIKSHNTWALMKSFDWNMATEDVSFTAETLPTAILSVEDETITSIAPEGGISGGSSSGSGGGGGGGGSYVLPIASASTLGGVRVGSGLSIDSGTGVLSATGGGDGSFNGGEIKQDLWLHTGEANYGSKLWFGDKGSGNGYVYLYEDSDDHLVIYAANGISLQAGSGHGVSIPSLLVALSALSDVSLNNLSNGQALVYRNGSWVNEIIQGGGSSYSAGSGIDITGSNVISLKTASSSALGGIKVGSGLSIDSSGVLSSTGGGSYTLPTASSSALGGIKLGYSGSGKNYPVELDSNDRAYVSVPWEGGSGGGGGTVTSVGISVPSFMSRSGSPVTTAGEIEISFNSQAKNKVLASPVSASGAPSFRVLEAADIPDLSGTYVTLNTTQTISGAKTFTTNPVNIGSTSGLAVNASSYIDIGNARLVWDGEHNALHITKKPGTTEAIGLYADNFVAAGGPGSGTTIKYVNLANDAAYTALATKDKATIYTIGTTTVSKIYLGTTLIYPQS